MERSIGRVWGGGRRQYPHNGYSDNLWSRAPPLLAITFCCAAQKSCGSCIWITLYGTVRDAIMTKLVAGHSEMMTLRHGWAGGLLLL